MTWTLARRAERLNPSTIRELLKLTERPGIVSLAGGLPAADGFPVAALREACDEVLSQQPREALQYAASEGFGPLREWVAADLRAQGVAADAGRVLITNGSQQGLDLVGKVLLDPGSAVAVEAPTYLGALQAFAPYEPAFAPLEGDDEGPLPEALIERRWARFAYLLPNFQNPTGRCLSAERRRALAEAALACGLPVLEDNPYGELWYDAPPPPPLAARLGEQAVLLGSFSKVLAPGLRLGWLLAPTALFAKLLQAKQAADLHTPGFNQRLVHAVLASGMLPAHLQGLRQTYRARRDAMAKALTRHLGDRARWRLPEGGMFFWLALPEGVDTMALLPRAIEAGVAFVPGTAFFAQGGHGHTLRLSFVTASPEAIERGVAALAGVLHGACQREAA
jgi:2-aminoadipate transaminase